LHEEEQARGRKKSKRDPGDGRCNLKEETTERGRRGRQKIKDKKPDGAGRKRQLQQHPPFGPALGCPSAEIAQKVSACLFGLVRAALGEKACRGHKVNCVYKLKANVTGLSFSISFR
jgi:hypothetical protein